MKAKVIIKLTVWFNDIDSCDEAEGALMCEVDHMFEEGLLSGPRIDSYETDVTSEPWDWEKGGKKP